MDRGRDMGIKRRHLKARTAVEGDSMSCIHLETLRDVVRAASVSFLSLLSPRFLSPPSLCCPFFICLLLGSAVND